MKIELDRKGVQQLLKTSGVKGVVHRFASAIASSVRTQKPDADVVVDDYVTDRAASSVTIRDARGRLWQARDGVLTRASSSAGLKVTER